MLIHCLTLSCLAPTTSVLTHQIWLLTYVKHCKFSQVQFYIWTGCIPSNSWSLKEANYYCVCKHMCFDTIVQLQVNYLTLNIFNISKLTSLHSFINSSLFMLTIWICSSISVHHPLNYSRRKLFGLVGSQYCLTRRTSNLHYFSHPIYTCNMPSERKAKCSAEGKRSS